MVNQSMDSDSDTTFTVPLIRQQVVWSFSFDILFGLFEMKL